MDDVTIIPPYHHLNGTALPDLGGQKLLSFFEWLNFTHVFFQEVDQSTSEEWSEPEQRR